MEGITSIQRHILTEANRALLKDAVEALRDHRDVVLRERMHDLLLRFDRALEEQRTHHSIHHGPYNTQEHN
jgi:hypothetical protein